MKTNLQSLHGSFQGDPIRIEESSFNKIEVEEFDVLPNKCIENSYKLAIANDCKMVEGLLLVQIDGRISSIEPHCWNIMDGRYYDTTIDKLIHTQNYQEIIGEKEVKHIYFQCVEYLPKDSGYQTDTSIFYYNYDCLAEFIKSKLEKNKI